MYLNTGNCSIAASTDIPHDRLAKIEMQISRLLPGGWSISRRSTGPVLDGVLEMPVSEDCSSEFVPKLIERVLRVPAFSDMADARLAYITYACTEGLRQEKGVFTLHGSAASVASQGVLLIGDKGSGKTNTLMSLAEHSKCVIIGDDLISIRMIGESAFLLPGKRIAAVRNGSPKHIFFYDVKEMRDLGAVDESSTLVPLKVAIRVNVNSAAQNLPIVPVESAVVERLRLHEILMRFVSGYATPIILESDSLFGPAYCVDTLIATRSRARLIEYLLAGKLTRLQASDPDQASSMILRRLGVEE